MYQRMRSQTLENWRVSPVQEWACSAASSSTTWAEDRPAGFMMTASWGDTRSQVMAHQTRQAYMFLVLSCYVPGWPVIQQLVVLHQHHLRFLSPLEQPDTKTARFFSPLWSWALATNSQTAFSHLQSGIRKHRTGHLLNLNCDSRQGLSHSINNNT